MVVLQDLHDIVWRFKLRFKEKELEQERDVIVKRGFNNVFVFDDNIDDMKQCTFELLFHWQSNRGKMSSKEWDSSYNRAPRTREIPFGKFEWKIADPSIIDAIRRASSNEYIASPFYEYCGVRWYVPQHLCVHVPMFLSIDRYLTLFPNENGATRIGLNVAASSEHFPLILDHDELVIGVDKGAIKQSDFDDEFMVKLDVSLSEINRNASEHSLVFDKDHLRHFIDIKCAFAEIQKVDTLTVSCTVCIHHKEAETQQMDDGI